MAVLVSTTAVRTLRVTAFEKMRNQAIYLDHAATTPVRQEVFEVMQPYFMEKFGNPSSVYSLAQDARDAIAESRERISAVLNCRTTEVVFTGNGTESNNTALKGAAYVRRNTGRHIITTAIEHHSVLHPLDQLEHSGYEVTSIPVDPSGMVDPLAVAEAVRKDTVLISIMAANNEVGTIQEIGDVSRMAKKRSHELGGDVLVHTDAAQAAGKLSIDVDELGVDLLSMTGHKIYAPKGIGILYVRRGVAIEPLLSGGGQERQRRSGTENVPYIVGIAKALELAELEREQTANRTGRLRDMIEAGILDRLPNTTINGNVEHRLPGITNLSFPGVEGEPILIGLDFKGIAASSGSACSSASLAPSHVLLAMGIPEDLALGSIRISLGRDTTESEAQEVITVIPEVVERLRTL